MSFEAGLPSRAPDEDGIYNRYGHGLGVVRAVNPRLWCVDVEPQEGGMLRAVQVEGDVLPEVHTNTDNPQYVVYWFMDGNLQDPWCRPLHWRRLRGPESDDQPEKRKYHEHLQIQRVGDMTIRISKDGKKIWLYDAESGDYALYDQAARTFHVIGPHVFLGSDDKDRLEYHSDPQAPANAQVRLVIPKFFMGKLGLQDTDGISYTPTLLHLMSTAIKLTATDSITLDPPHIYFGTGSATQRIVLGDALKDYINLTVKAMIDAHVHTGVQTGSGTSGPPTTPFPAMPDSTLSTIARISE